MKYDGYYITESEPEDLTGDDRLCDYCPLENKGCYYTLAGHAGCEGSHCADATESYLEVFDDQKESLFRIVYADGSYEDIDSDKLLKALL